MHEWLVLVQECNAQCSEIIETAKSLLAPSVFLYITGFIITADRCQRQGTNVDQTKFISLCSVCIHTTVLDDTFYPRFLTEKICSPGSSANPAYRDGCLFQHGPCKLSIMLITPHNYLIIIFRCYDCSHGQSSFLILFGPVFLIRTVTFPFLLPLDKLVHLHMQKCMSANVLLYIWTTWDIRLQTGYRVLQTLLIIHFFSQFSTLSAITCYKSLLSPINMGMISFYQFPVFP